ncbi:pseudouridine synthase [Corynebacterium sp. P7202]|uniref:RNA pseudouridylate synthase n=1 Tax=Corynebacterium pygosceleis TaxID=2800406 RepID=A0A9Q4GIS4_9CORY|nr:pseudouridine synthase [Corynebacterium pygosceleis]MCK7637992.1 pseudouridine synthase [Corynebacterium pygosceleis]MCX7468708.1 pseudouridine synthase [Corynebacterium pygosceleis]
MSRRPLPVVDGISPRRVILRGVVPADRTYVAGDAGDSPFRFGETIPAGTLLERPVPAWFAPVIPPEPPIPFSHEVLETGDRYVVVDKPHFLPATTNGRIIRETIQTRLRVELDNPDIVPLHRLDRLTAGVLLCSTDPGTRAAYQTLFQRRQVTKTYLARVAAEPPVGEEWITVDLPMRKISGERAVRVTGGGTPTRTRIRRVSDRLVELRPVTGYTHQLRVLLAHLGCPIVGDDTYPVDTGLDFTDFSVSLGLVSSPSVCS